RGYSLVLTSSVPRAPLRAHFPSLFAGRRYRLWQASMGMMVLGPTTTNFCKRYSEPLPTASRLSGLARNCASTQRRWVVERSRLREISSIFSHSRDARAQAVTERGPHSNSSHSRGPAVIQTHDISKRCFADTRSGRETNSQHSKGDLGNRH